jgi:pimeloyl-ACP methyl ester carboxylesterase
MTETMIDVGGGDTVWADDSGGDLPPLVLLHPGVGDSRIWEPLLPGLTGTHRVIRYDARGYGRSPAPTSPYSLFDDLVTVLDHFGLDRVPIVGCSQGGDCALGLAVTAPARVSALILLCPGISGFEVPDDPGVAAEYERAAAEGADAVAEVGLRLWARAGRTPEVVAQLRSAARAWLSQGDLEQPNPPVFDRLGEITVPVSLLVGDADRDWLLESNRQAARRIPGCVYVELPGLDHLPPLRVPDRVLRLIRDTLATVAP